MPPKGERMGAPCKEVNNTQPTKYIYLYMTIETTRSMYCLWTGYFQDSSRKHVVMDKRIKAWSQMMAKKLLHKSSDMAAVSQPFMNKL